MSTKEYNHSQAVRTRAPTCCNVRDRCRNNQGIRVLPIHYPVCRHRVSSVLQLIGHHLPIFHDKRYTLEECDILQRILSHSNDICICARCNLTDLAVSIEEGRCH